MASWDRKHPSDLHFRISPEVVGHSDSFHLLNSDILLILDTVFLLLYKHTLSYTEGIWKSLMCTLTYYVFLLLHYCVLDRDLVSVFMHYERVLLSTAQSSFWGLSLNSSALIFISMASVSFHLYFEQWPVVEWWRTRLSAALYRLVSLATTATTWPATGCWRPLRVKDCTCTSKRWPSPKMMTGLYQSTHSILSYYTLISQLMFKETVGEAQSVSSQCVTLQMWRYSSGHYLLRRERGMIGTAVSARVKVDESFWDQTLALL